MLCDWLMVIFLYIKVANVCGAILEKKKEQNST